MAPFRPAVPSGLAFYRVGLGRLLGLRGAYLGLGTDAGAMGITLGGSDLPVAPSVAEVRAMLGIARVLGAVAAGVTHLVADIGIAVVGRQLAPVLVQIAHVAAQRG